MRLLFLILFILITGCSSQNENIKPSVLKTRERLKFVTNYHPATKSTANGRENSTFLPYYTGESAIVGEWWNTHNVIPINREVNAIYVGADWFDWENDVTEDLTFEVYASAPTISNTIPADSTFVLVGSASSFDTYIYLDLSTSYPAQFGSILNKDGQYIAFKFQWRDLDNNISTPVYETKEIELSSSVKETLQSYINGWTHHGIYDEFTDSAYVVTDWEEVHTNDTTAINSGITYLNGESSFTDIYYVGKITFYLNKTNPNIAGISFGNDGHADNGLYDAIIGDYHGNENVYIENWGFQYSFLKINAQYPCTLLYKFDGVKITIHLEKII